SQAQATRLQPPAQPSPILPPRQIEPVPSRATSQRTASSGRGAARTPSVHPELSQPSHREASDEELLETRIQLAFAVARIDGRLARKEKELIVAKMQRRNAPDQAMDNRVKALMAHYEIAAIDIEGCIRRIKEELPAALRNELLELACQVA